MATASCSDEQTSKQAADQSPGAVASLASLQRTKMLTRPSEVMSAAIAWSPLSSDIERMELTIRMMSDICVSKGQKVRAGCFFFFLLSFFPSLSNVILRRRGTHVDDAVKVDVARSDGRRRRSQALQARSATGAVLVRE